MARRGKTGVNQPWFWKARGAWYVTLGGSQVRLAEGHPEAVEVWAGLLKGGGEARRDGVAACLGKTVDDFLSSQEGTLAVRTVDFYRERLAPLRAHLGEGFPLATLRGYHIHEWFRKHPSWGGSYRRGCLVAVRRVCSWASRLELLPTGFKIDLEAPAPGRRERVLSAEEHTALVAAARPPFARVLRLAWLTGMRPEELCRARLEYLDHRESCLVFPRARSKGRRRQRVVHLCPEALALCLAEAAARPGEGPLLVNRLGAAWTASAFSCAFARISRRDAQELVQESREVPADAGQGRQDQVQAEGQERPQETLREARHEPRQKYRMYDLRHSFCHRCLRAGMSAVTVARLMGHSSTAMVDRHYSHLEQAGDFLKAELSRLA